MDDPHNRTFSIVSGVLPPTISALFGFLLPIIMRRLTKYQGAITRSRLDRAVMARYFAFLIISNFLTFSLFGAAWSEYGRMKTVSTAGLIFDCPFQMPSPGSSSKLARRSRSRKSWTIWTACLIVS